MRTMCEIRGNPDTSLQAIADALREYETKHPQAQVVVYRQNCASIRIRVVDKDFERVSKADRHDAVWRFLEDLPEEVQNEISVLLALTPAEMSKSFANLEFDNPLPSRL